MGVTEPALYAPRCVGEKDCRGWEAHQVLGSRDSYGGGCDAGADKCYSSGDIYHLEACLISSICINGDEIFRLEVGELWHCELSQERLSRLRGWLLSE